MAKQEYRTYRELLHGRADISMQGLIATEPQEHGLSAMPDTAGDYGTGKLDTWNRSSGRPFNYLYVGFSEVNAMRNYANWDVFGKAQMLNPSALVPFSLSIDTDRQRLDLVLDFMWWTIPTVGGPIDVTNSQPSRELMIKFRKQVYMEAGGWYMSEGSVLYVRDADGA